MVNFIAFFVPIPSHTHIIHSIPERMGQDHVHISILSSSYKPKTLTANHIHMSKNCAHDLFPSQLNTPTYWSCHITLENHTQCTLTRTRIKTTSVFMGMRPIYRYRYRFTNTTRHMIGENTTWLSRYSKAKGHTTENRPRSMNITTVRWVWYQQH